MFGGQVCRDAFIKRILFALKRVCLTYGTAVRLTTKRSKF